MQHCDCGPFAHLHASSQGLFSSTRSLAYLPNNEGRAYQSLRQGGGKSSQREQHLSMWQDCLPYYGIDGFSAFLLRVRKFVWICVSSLLQKNFNVLSFYSCRIIDKRCCATHACIRQKQTRLKWKQCFWHDMLSCYAMDSVFMCWCLAVWCCVSGTAFGQRVYCALL